MYSTYRVEFTTCRQTVSCLLHYTFLLPLDSQSKSWPHSAITWYYYYYYFLHLAWESTFCEKDFADTRMSVLKHWHIYIYIYIYIYILLTGGGSQLADRQSVVYFIALSFFHLTLKVSAKAFSQPHSGTITWYYYYYYYYYYFLHFAWESTSCNRDFAETEE
jgi:hypothetical protein